MRRRVYSGDFGIKFSDDIEWRGFLEDRSFELTPFGLSLSNTSSRRATPSIPSVGLYGALWVSNVPSGEGFPRVD